MDWFSKNKATLAGVLLVGLAVALRLLAVDQTQHPTGWDGYYYVMQVHSWMTYGYLQSPDFSLIYPYFIFMAFVSGNVILGFKIGVAILSGLLTGAVYFSLTRKGVPASWACVAGAYLAYSPLTTYFVLQFPKNALGLIFLILFIGKIAQPNKAIPAVLFLATVVSHRMTGGLAVIAGSMYAVRHVSWKWIVTGAAAVLTISFLPGILHVSDLARFDGQFVAMPQWTPFSFYRIFPNSLDWYFKLELVLISIVILLSLFLLIKNRREVPFSSWLWLCVTLISIFPFFRFSPGDAGHRFFLIAPVALIMLVPFREWRPRVQWTAALVFAVASVFSFHSYKPDNLDPPNDRYSYIVSKLTTHYDHREYPLVIAHSSLAEMIIFKTDFDALNWLPPEDMKPQRVLRLVKGVSYPDLRKYLDNVDREQLRRIVPGYIALPEDAWQRFVAFARKENDQRIMAQIFGGSNPMENRPYYLTKGKIR